MTEIRTTNRRRQTFALSITLMLMCLMLTELLFMTSVTPSANLRSPEPTTGPQGWGGAPIQIQEAPTDLDFQGAFTFTNELVGSPPSGWAKSGNAQAQIVEAFQGHHMVLHISDTSESEAVTLTYSFPTEQQWGTMEWWCYGLSTIQTNDFRLVVAGDGGDAIILIFKNEQLWFQDNLGTNLICALPNSEWHHFRLTFSPYGEPPPAGSAYAHGDTFSLWLDGVLVDNPDQNLPENDDYLKHYFPFYPPVYPIEAPRHTTLTDLTITSSAAAATGVSMYFDAFDFSWADGFYPNRNQYAYTLVVPDIVYSESITVEAYLKKAVYASETWGTAPLVNGFPTETGTQVHFWVDCDADGVYSAETDSDLATVPTDANGKASYTDAVTIPLLDTGAYQIGAEAVFTAEYFYDFEGASDPTTSWHWWEGEDVTWKGGKHDISTVISFQGDNSLQVETDTSQSGTSNGICGGYRLIEHCNSKFMVDAYMKFAPSSTPADSQGDSAAIWLAQTCEHIPGEPPTEGVGILMNRFYNGQQVKNWIRGGESAVISGIVDWEDKVGQWYRVKLEGDLRADAWSYTIYSEYQGETLIKAKVSNSAVASYLGAVQVGTGGKTGNTAYFDDIFIETEGTLAVTATFSISNTDYLGLYSFTDDVVGAQPSGWTVDLGKDVSPYLYNSIEVVTDKDNHNKVVRIVSALNGYANPIKPVVFENEFSSPQNSGTIEFWLYVESGGAYGDIVYVVGTSIYGGNDHNIFMLARHPDGYWAWCSWGSWYNIQSGLAAEEDHWYHIAMTFNDNTPYQVHLTIDDYSGNLYEGDQPYCYPGLTHTPSRLAFKEYGSPDTDPDQVVHVDAVDYSWATGYYLNRNMDFA